MPLPEQNIRNVKRKRGDKESEEDKEAELRRKLHHALREVRRIVRKTRTFEIQRTLKKLRDARRKDPESDVTKDLGAQMEALKHLSYDQLAHSALMTKLKKDKAFTADPIIQALSVELASHSVPLGAGTPMAKAQSRILSSKVLASEIALIMESLRTFLHSPVGPESVGQATDNPHPSQSISKRRRIGTDHDKDALSPSLMDSYGKRGVGEHENTSNDEAAAKVDDGWESGTIDAPSESDDLAGGADDDSSSVFSSADLSPEDPKTKKSQPHGSNGQSGFLPSLSVGFTRGDSGSEFSDHETRLVDGIKKNRRGQRARRAIWEKTFGKNAHHIKKQQRQDAERRLPGFVSVDRRSGKGNSSQPRRTPIQFHAAYGHEQINKPTLRGSKGVRNSGPVKGQSERIRSDGHVRRKQEDRPIHPSWEAKRKQKSAGIVPSQGTKIVF